MGIIRLLDEHLANQIAAGEVVERPASVLKELIENAVDAGATTIDVAAEEGGLALLRIVDDGSGIQPDDLRTAFQRHATSKIATGRDLFKIETLGFRGEALPSIAAVAKVRCASASDESGLGRVIEIEGGQIKLEEDVAAPRGTDMTIRELFFNTPARLKYMRTVQTELGHLSDVVYRQALANPDIAFTFAHNGSTLLRTPGNGDLRQVVGAIYGTAAAKAMLDVSAEHLDYTLSGLTAMPVETRSNRNAVTVLVNGRYVRSPAVVQPLLQAYHTLLPINRYPLAVLDLRMHPSLVDVNVHPAKLEVRFSKETELRKFVEEAIKAALGSQAYIPSGTAARTPKTQAWVQDQIRFQLPPAAENDPVAPPSQGNRASGPVHQDGGSVTGGSVTSPNAAPGAADVRFGPEAGGESSGDERDSAPPAQMSTVPSSNPTTTEPPSKAPNVPSSEPPTGSSTRGPVHYDPAAFDSLVRESAAAGEARSSGDSRPAVAGPGPNRSSSYSAGDATRSAGSLSAARPGSSASYAAGGTRSGGDWPPRQTPAARVPEQVWQAAYAAPAANPGSAEFPELHWIGQLHGTYLVAQNETGLYLIDQHAAHERIHYEYFFDKFGRPEDASQELLLPVTLGFSPDECLVLRGKLGLLEQVGVYLEEFGGNTFIVRAVPHWMPKGDEEEIVREITEWALAEKGVDLRKIREKASILCSCKASIKANQALTREAGETLLRRLARCRQPYTCPHGRPIVVSFTTYELEKMFKRVMS